MKIYKTKGIFAIILTIILAVNVLFVPTQADAASKKVKIKVISKVKVSGQGEAVYKYDSNGLVKSKADCYGNAPYYYTYNKNHQIVSIKNDKSMYKMNGKISAKYKYDSKNRLKSITCGKNGNRSVKYFYDKNNQIVSAEGKEKRVSGEYLEKREYKNNKLSKVLYSTVKYSGKYPNIKAKFVYNKNNKNEEKYLYNSDGTIKSTSYFRYSYKYNKKNQLISITEKTGKSKTVFKFSYKTITVPEAYVETIKKQQEEIATPARFGPNFIYYECPLAVISGS